MSNKGPLIWPALAFLYSPLTSLFSQISSGVLTQHSKNCSPAESCKVRAVSRSCFQNKVQTYTDGVFGYLNRGSLVKRATQSKQMAERSTEGNTVNFFLTTLYTWESTGIFMEGRAKFQTDGTGTKENVESKNKIAMFNMS